MSLTPVLKIESLHKSFGTRKVLVNIRLEIKKGEVLCILGPSGAGKSTLLRCINMLEEPDSGDMWLDGELIRHRASSDGKLVRRSHHDLSRLRSQMGMVFQHFNVWPHMTVLQNIIEGPITVLKKDRQGVIEKAKAILEKVGLLDKLNEYPSRLSGGQQQRVAIARALMMEPKLMLFDEVTSALDPELVGEVLETMATLAAEGTTMLVVTHEIGFAKTAATRIMFMDNGQVLEDTSPETFFTNPSHERTRLFLSRVLS